MPAVGDLGTEYEAHDTTNRDPQMAILWLRRLKKSADQLLIARNRAGLATLGNFFTALLAHLRSLFCYEYCYKRCSIGTESPPKRYL